ncbi:MAG: amidase family protein, partial [Candidatus Bathyarchaeota archaeon]|nr:amidase family protein [Candidatus Bathyarchaeota archaeon]
PHERTRPPRLGLLRGYFQENAREEVWEGFEDALDRLNGSGAEVVETPQPRSFDAAHASHRVIMATEAASVHEGNFEARRADYRVNIRGLVASGLLVPVSTYIRAQRIRAKFVSEVEAILGGVDCLLTPSAPTPAPRGLESTGDPAFNSPWSLCGFPTMTVPSGLTGDGLPLGVQLTGPSFGEGDLLAVAEWCERSLGFKGSWPEL